MISKHTSRHGEEQKRRSNPVSSGFAPNDRLHEAMLFIRPEQGWIASSLVLLAMTGKSL
jgi:hypothetical protein